MLRLLAAVLVMALAVVPLAALGLAGLSPDPDPLSGVTPSLWTLWTQADASWLLLRSLALAVGVVLISVPAGTWLAWAEHRLDLHRGWFVLTLLPLAMPSYILAASIAHELGPSGLFPVFDRVTGLPAATVVIALVTTPYVQLIVGSALISGSAAEEEAARSLGASPARVFRDVVLPRLRPAIGTGGLLALLYALSDFGAVAVLDAPVLTWRLYQAVTSQALPRAALLGMLLILAALPLFVAARWVQASRTGAVANPRPPARMQAGRWTRVGTLVLVGAVVGLGVGLPVLTLVRWTLDGVLRGLPFAPLGTPVLHTVGAAAVGTLVTLVAAFPPALVVGARRRTGLLDAATYATSALPGVLLAFGWMLAALHLSRLLPGRGVYAALLGSGALLALGYTTRYLAEVYTPLKTGFWRFDRRLWASHRALAAPPMRFGPVVAADLSPSVAAAALLGFLALLKELPVTLLLGSATGLQTLAFRVWDRHSEALWHDAGAAGLCLLCLASVALLGSLKWR